MGVLSTAYIYEKIENLSNKDFVVTLALKILIYALVNCGFSGFASLKLSLVIQILTPREGAQRLVGHPLVYFMYIT